MDMNMKKGIIWLYFVFRKFSHFVNRRFQVSTLGIVEQKFEMDQIRFGIERMRIWNCQCFYLPCSDKSRPLREAYACLLTFTFPSTPSLPFESLLKHRN